MPQNVTKVPLAKIWWLAIRPRTLPAAVAGVITGLAVALPYDSFKVLPALAAFCIALLLQIGSNLANDVFDHERGADAAREFGPTRVTASGMLTPAQVKRGMVVVFGLAGLIGLYLVFTVSWILLPIGAAAILAAILYTAGPFPLGYHGLGDLFVFVFFGLASVAGTAFLQLHTVPPAGWGMSIPLGLIIVGILVVNNLRDIDSDRLAGKHTLAVRLGERFSKIQYTACLVLSYLTIPVLALAGWIPWLAMLTWLSLPLAWKNIRMVYTRQGSPLNAALAGTGQLALLYSLLFLASILLGGIIL